MNYCVFSGQNYTMYNYHAQLIGSLCVFINEWIWTEMEQDLPQEHKKKTQHNLYCPTLLINLKEMVTYKDEYVLCSFTWKMYLCTKQQV